MPSNNTVWVTADWAQLETWLVAHFSGDQTLYAELESSLHGGHKIHALNAALIYGIDPADAKTHMVDFQGQKVSAYDGGKRCGHAFNYGMGANHMSQTYWLTKAFANEIIGKLSDKYRGVVAWRERMADEVFGQARFKCPGCGHVERARMGCPACGTPRNPLTLTWDGWETQPTREMRTPFGRRRLYPGKRKESMNALAAQKPQSTGISMWYRSLQRLKGYEMRQGERHVWPTPNVPYRVVIGTYDSFDVVSYKEHALEIAAWLLWTMEQPWRQLDGKRFPAEAAIGGNLEDYNSDENPKGLRECGMWAPLAAEWSVDRIAGAGRLPTSTQDWSGGTYGGVK